MFESVVLRKAEFGEPVSAGQLAEALLYYQKVQLIIDLGTLRTLVRQIGIDTLLDLLRRPDLSAVHCEEAVATHTERWGALERHTFIAFSVAGDSSTGALKTRDERVEHILTQEGLGRREARRRAQEFVQLVPARRLSGDTYVQGGVPPAATRDLRDGAFVIEAVRRALACLQYDQAGRDDLVFEVVESDGGFFAFTNINFEAISRRRARNVPPEPPVTAALLLSHVLDARADLALAAFYGGDFRSSAITSSIVQLRYAELLKRTSLNMDAHEHFRQIVLPETPKLAEVIDAGERSFKEFLRLLQEAERFKGWIKSVGPDENLVQAYLRDIQSVAWLETLPAKLLRYLLAQALASTGLAELATAAGVADHFLLDRLLRGWRPNHFVNRRLSTFLGKE